MAKRRTLPRPSREGAAMLVVLMVLIMTTATATFAVHATTVEMRSAGYARVAMQTNYVAEGGAYAALGYVDAIGARAAFTQYSRTRVRANTSLAPAHATLNRETNVLRIQMTDFDGGFDVVGPPLERNLARTPSLGPRNNLVPSFTVDGTDVYRTQRLQAGRDQSGRNPMMYARINFTSRGRAAPPSDFTSAGDVRSYHESSANARAMAEMGPFPE
ncbi:MAG: pilus assembly PilX N-terminal domain-containing protein [Sandaracinaceae bacterium]|nr:pilus assembly PilX N-terminal domain-containing protein [Sandaracinaceae bacterium]